MHRLGPMQQFLMYVRAVHKKTIIPTGRIIGARVGAPDRSLFVLHVLPPALFVFEPILVVCLAVGHGGAPQSQHLSQLVVVEFGSSEVGSSEVGSSEVR